MLAIGRLPHLLKISSFAICSIYHSDIIKRSTSIPRLFLSWLCVPTCYPTVVSVYTPSRVGLSASPSMEAPSLPHDLTAPKIFINDHEFVEESVDDDDIYRGDRSSQTTELGSATSLKSFSTASSGSIRLAGGRLGALSTHLEQAITRWARKNWGDSSASIASSGSSGSSFRTVNKSSRRKRRPSSLADIQHREESERAVAARIRARGIGRVVPREFNLYVPPSSPLQDAEPIEEESRVVRTFSLDVMLPHLSPLLRNSGKYRRPRHQSRLDQDHLYAQQVHSAEDESRDASRTDAYRGPSLTAAEKGKNKIDTTPPPQPVQTASTSRRDPITGTPQQAWWLDVSSPSWKDMKTLGQVNTLLLYSWPC